MNKKTMQTADCLWGGEYIVSNSHPSAVDYEY